MNVASLPHLCLAGVLSPGTLLAQLNHGDVWCSLDGCCPAVCFPVSIQPTAKCSGAAAVPSSPCSALVCSPKSCFRLGPGSGSGSRDGGFVYTFLYVQEPGRFLCTTH